MRTFLGRLCRRLGVTARQRLQRLMRRLREGLAPKRGGGAHAPGSGLAEPLVELLQEDGEALRALAERYRAQLVQSDHAMSRIVEDLIHMLVERNVIDFAELPQATQRLLDERALLRAELEALTDLDESRPVCRGGRDSGG